MNFNTIKFFADHVAQDCQIGHAMWRQGDDCGEVIDRIIADAECIASDARKLRDELAATPTP